MPNFMSAETISFEVPERCETLEDGLRKIAKIITSEQFISKALEHLNEGDGSIYRIRRVLAGIARFRGAAHAPVL